MAKLPDNDSGGILMPILVSLLVVVGLGTAGLFGYIGYTGYRAMANQPASSSTSGTYQAKAQTPTQNQKNQVPAQNQQEGSGSTDSQSTSGSQTQNNPPKGSKSSGALGDYYVEIKDAALAKDTDGNPAIIITYNWTNNSDKTTSEAAVLYGKAFQDGIQLEPAFVLDSDVYTDAGNSMKEIRPGASLTVQSAYVMTSESSPVEFEVTELISLSDEMVSKNFDVSSLPIGNANPASAQVQQTSTSKSQDTQNQEPVKTTDSSKNTNSVGKERRSNWSSGAYLGSSESDKYHDYECRAAKNILQENEVWFSSEAAAQAAGYFRCGICW